MGRCFGLLSAALILGGSVGPARAQFVSGSDGSDGAFNPVVNTVVDLSLAGTGPGTGAYDVAHWTVVFNYTRINIPAGVTITFKNHPSWAPVVWLASDSVVVSGQVILDGANAPTVAGGYAEPGPGGFAGARAALDPVASPATGGFGPGGAPPVTLISNNALGGGGGYGTPGEGGPNGAGGGTYGNVAVLPLIGGSGGSVANRTGTGIGGGAGGGALLIASSEVVTLNANSRIQANGGTGNNGVFISYAGGSGGAIRLIANSISGNGLLRAQGGNASFSSASSGGDGRIRVEAFDIDLADPGLPAWTSSTAPGPVFPTASAPTLTATTIGGVAVPADPAGGIVTTDVLVEDSTQVVVQIAATNIPVGTTVDVHIVPNGGAFSVVTSTPLAGTLASSNATATAMLPPGRVEIYLRANWTP